MTRVPDNTRVLNGRRTTAQVSVMEIPSRLLRAAKNINVRKPNTKPARTVIGTKCFPSQSKLEYTMRKRDSIVLNLAMLQSCLLFSQAADHKPSGFYFNGKEFHLGMSEQDAMTELAACCRLSPPPRKSSVDATFLGKPQGYFILPKDEKNVSILGAIWFKGQKVARVSRELAQDVDTSSDDLVAFMRALKRSFPQGVTSAVIGVRHEQASNGESDVMTIEFPDQRRIVINLMTLDKAAGSKRDFVTVDEVIGSTE
jgi:hypothetical protein